MSPQTKPPTGVGLGLGLGLGDGDGLGLGDGDTPGEADAEGDGLVANVIEKLSWHSGTGLPSRALGLDWGAVGATGFSSRSLKAVRIAKTPSSKLTAPIAKNTQFFLRLFILFISNLCLNQMDWHYHQTAVNKLQMQS